LTSRDPTLAFWRTSPGPPCYGPLAECVRDAFLLSRSEWPRWCLARRAED